MNIASACKGPVARCRAPAASLPSLPSLPFPSLALPRTLARASSQLRRALPSLSLSSSPSPLSWTRAGGARGSDPASRTPSSEASSLSSSAVLSRLPSRGSLPAAFPALATAARASTVRCVGQGSAMGSTATAAAPGESSAPPFVGDLGVRKGFVEAVGNTPLIRLNKASELTGCEIYGKCEFLNPGGSVKDRAALYIIKDAEERGLLKPGGVIVEGTAGNTGIGLALVANAKGYKTVIVIPKTQSQEKKDMLRIAGATLVEVPAVPYKNPNNYVKYSGRLAQKIAETNPAGAIWGNQFDNQANRRAHYETTGPEIWAQTGGKVDGFICAIGTGGTLAGTGKFLKEKNSKIRVGMADPMGAAMYSYFSLGVLESAGNSISEGIGQGRVTGNLEGWAVPDREGGVVDFWCQIPDEEALPICYDLLAEEGLCMGTSSGINVAGAIRLAKEMGPGHTIVTILCDLGTRYQGKIFNVEFLKSKGLPFPAWMDPSVPSGVPEVFEEVEQA